MVKVKDVLDWNLEKKLPEIVEKWTAEYEVDEYYERRGLGMDFFRSDGTVVGLNTFDDLFFMAVYCEDGIVLFHGCWYYCSDCGGSSVWDVEYKVIQF